MDEFLRMSLGAQTRSPLQLTRNRRELIQRHLQVVGDHLRDAIGAALQ